MSKLPYIICDDFYPKAEALRRDFSTAFQDPRKTDKQRFVWDFWYQNEQYRHLRTPALSFFRENKIHDFLTRLTRWGQQNLGCSALSPPWLSYYVDGCFQSLHGDVPHGPFAYVYSLTLKPELLGGGRTLLLKEEILNFWKGFDPTRGFEAGDVLHKIENKFNRLVVFDPRIPHGVEEVRGIVDPLKARVVLHGWFTEPTPFMEGALKTAPLEDFLNVHLGRALAPLPVDAVNGLLTFKIQIAGSGQVGRIKIVVNTLKEIGTSNKQNLVKELQLAISAWKFPKARAHSTFTLPLYFK